MIYERADEARRRLDEEEKTRVKAELARHDANHISIANILIEMMSKRGLRLDEPAHEQVTDFARALIDCKDKHGAEHAQRTFSYVVDADNAAGRNLRDIIDTNGDRMISVQEFMDVMNERRLGSILRMLDVNQDGMVSRGEATEGLRNAGLTLKGVKGGFDKSAAVLGRALAFAGVQFKQVAGDASHNPLGAQYVAVVPPEADNTKKVR